MSNADLVILGEKIAHGKTIIHHELARLHTRTPVAIPIIIQKAKAPGGRPALSFLESVVVFGMICFGVFW